MSSALTDHKHINGVQSRELDHDLEDTPVEKTMTQGSSDQPAGGFDDTPIPYAPPGYTLKITIHRAQNLPLGDFSTMSSDPYVFLILDTDLRRRHKQDPDMTFRTRTIRKNINPDWEAEWIVANVPATGFNLKCRVYDEDSADQDDRLGTAYVEVDHIDEKWSGIKEQAFKVRKKMGSNRAYILRSIAAALSKNISVKGELIISVECLGKTPGETGGQIYTIGPNNWTRHFSPLIGRLVGTKDSVHSEAGKPAVSKYNFQAIQMQLTGPVPSQLYHRYVEFRPFVAGMFTSQSIRGRLLNRALHHQHNRIYTYDRSTLYGTFPAPCEELTRQFLEFVHYAQGGRIFTYVLTLDGQWRFTETGKEFGIDLLSKHTMHSNVSIYIAYSGEFFVRRTDSSLNHHHHHHHHRHRSRDTKGEEKEGHDAQVIAHREDSAMNLPINGIDEPTERASNDRGAEDVTFVSNEPSDYELIIDNDSGTYRPNAALLPQLKEFFENNLPGLHIKTLDCQKDAEEMAKLKAEQREKKKESGRPMAFLQRRVSSVASSISSSDEEELEHRATDGAKHGKFHWVKDPKGRYREWVVADHVGHPAEENPASKSQPAASAPAPVPGKAEEGAPGAQPSRS